MFPLCYAPISLVARHVGRSGALLVAALSAMVWFGSNFVTGVDGPPAFALGYLKNG